MLLLTLPSLQVLPGALIGRSAVGDILDPGASWCQGK